MPEFEAIISSLPPDTQTILKQLAAGGAGLTGRELLGLLAKLTADATATQRATIWRAVIWLANAGRIPLASLMEASSLMAAGETAGLTAAASGGGAGAGGAVVGGGAGGAAAGGGGALAGATLVAFIAALLFAAEAAAFAYYSISAEAGTRVTIAPSGPPCSGEGPNDVVWSLWVRRIGSRTSYNAAIKAAMNHARKVMTCSGACSDDEDGPTCTPVAIPISVVPKNRFLWTTTNITYRVGCACL